MVETGTANEISDLNLTYLLLARRLVRDDAATAMFRLGMSRELADQIGRLSLPQIMKWQLPACFYAVSDMMITRFFR